MIQVLFRNYVILMRESATYMAAHGIKGSIVNISSVRGLSAHPEIWSMVGSRRR